MHDHCRTDNRNAEIIEILRIPLFFRPSITYNTNITSLAVDAITAIQDLQAASRKDQVCVLSMANPESMGKGPLILVNILL